MEFKKVLSRTLTTVVFGSGLLTNACFKKDIQKDSSKLSSYILDKKDIEFKQKIFDNKFSYFLYYYKDEHNKKIRYIEIYKDEKLYTIINDEVYYLDKDTDNTIDLKCDTDKIKCYDLSNNSNIEEKVEEIPFPKEEIK